MSVPFPIAPVWDLGKGSPTGGAGLVYPPDVADNLQVVGRNLEVPLPEVYPIPDATIFNAECQVASNIAGQTFVLAFTPDVIIPDANLGVMTSLTLYVQNMLATTNVTWTLLANGNPVPGYNLLTIFPGASPRAANTFDAPKRFTGRTQLTIQITNGDGGNYILGAAVSGWFWPIASDRRWKSAGPIDVE